MDIKRIFNIKYMSLDKLKNTYMLNLQIFPTSDGVNVWNDIAVTPTITESVELVFHWQPASGDAIYEIELYSGTAVMVFFYKALYRKPIRRK